MTSPLQSFAPCVLKWREVLRIKIWNYFSQLGEDKIQKRLAEALNGYEKQEEERKTDYSLENNTDLLGLRATLNQTQIW